MKTFEVKSTIMVLSDPCYEIPTWCQGIVRNVKNGTWICEVRINDGRISELIAYHKNLKEVDLIKKADYLNFSGGVDSGQFCYFDYKSYRNDNIVEGLDRLHDGVPICEDEPFYSFCCDRTLSSEMWGVLPGGVVVSSGYGDGVYHTRGLKGKNGKYIGFMTEFF